MKTRTLLLSALIIPAFSHAAVITGDPLLVTGTNQIDPTTGSNRGTYDVNLTTTVTTGGAVASKATLEALSDYATIQTFAGVTASAGTAPNAASVNIWDFTLRPDMRISFLGQTGATVGTGTGGGYTSGPTSTANQSMLFGNTNSNAITIEFGTYASSVFTADKGVAAAGFTFSRLLTTATATTWIASFYDGATLLSSQTVSAGMGGNAAALFSYQAGIGESITKITLGGTTGATYDSKLHFVDDIGFAPVPEPSAALLAALGLSFLVVRRRRNA